MTDVTEPSLALQPLPWQQVGWEQLVTRHLQQTMPHAILLTGQAGIGKKILLQTVAARLFCQTAIATQYACGQCSACRWYQQGTHPDFLYIAAHADTSIKIDEIRNIADFAVKTSQQGAYKIILIEESHRMTLAAANALLKILEEPSARTLFLLSSDSVAQLPATVRSRCQLLRAPLPQHGEALAWLADKIPDPHYAHFLLEMASGAPLQALALAASITQSDVAKLQQRINGLITSVHDPVAVATEWLAEQELSHIVTYLQLWIYHRITQQLYPGSTGLQLDTTHGILPMSALFHYWEQLLGARAALVNHANPNPLLLLESLLIRLVSLQIK